MPDPFQPRPATEPSDPAADNTASRADEPSEPYLTAEEPRFAPPAHAGEVGTFGRYRVLQKLGQGGMGAVYLGYDASLDRKIALKVMLPQFAASADARGRFLREARSAAKVKSDHVITIFEVSEERGVPFIAMEYLLGSPLDKFLKQRGDLPLAHVLRIGRETALGLAAAHERGLVHRDIKPANIWLEAPKGRVKILDFGLARPANDDAQITNSGAVLGTPAYMSPEQGRGLKVDHRTDLFSLGVMLYRLSTSKLPFTGSTTMAVLTSLAVDTPTPPRQLNPELPEALEAVITKLLAKSPAERFQSAQEVADALAEIARQQTSGPLPVVVAMPVPPMAVGAQTQNVWEGIEESESFAVPLATHAGAGAEPTSQLQRRKPDRTAPRLPIYLAAGAILVAVAAVVVVVSLAGKKGDPQANAPSEPPSDPGKREVKRPETRTIDPDRRAAEYVLNVGGVLQADDVPNIKTISSTARVFRQGVK